MVEFSARPLAGKKGIILGVANEHSIAYGCAQAFRGLGADIALTYSGEKAKPYVEPEAARVLIGPGEMACTRICLGPTFHLLRHPHVARQENGCIERLGERPHFSRPTMPS